jgi:DNA-directed RNA polymerase specialized sigma24 family protein
MLIPDECFPDLLQRFYDGDPDASRELFDGLNPVLLRAIRHMPGPFLQGLYDPDDMAQGAWASFMAQRDKQRFQTFGQAVSFLVVVARNHLVDARRKYVDGRHLSRRRRRSLDAPGGLPEPVAPATPPDAGLLAAERREALTRRHPLFADMLAMLDGGLTHEQIADQLNITDRHLRRLLQALRSMLGRM